jgi:hypothetical protein
MCCRGSLAVPLERPAVAHLRLAWTQVVAPSETWSALRVSALRALHCPVSRAHSAAVPPKSRPEREVLMERSAAAWKNPPPKVLLERSAAGHFHLAQALVTIPPEMRQVLWMSALGSSPVPLVAAAYSYPAWLQMAEPETARAVLRY